MVSIRRRPKYHMGWLLKITIFMVLITVGAIAYLTQVADRGLMLSSNHELEGDLKQRYLDFMRTFKISRIVAEEGKYSLPGIRIYKKGLFWARSIKGEIPRNSGFVILRTGDKLVLKTNIPVNDITKQYMVGMLTMIQIKMATMDKVEKNEKQVQTKASKPTLPATKNEAPKNNGFSLFK